MEDVILFFKIMEGAFNFSEPCEDVKLGPSFSKEEGALLFKRTLALHSSSHHRIS